MAIHPIDFGNLPRNAPCKQFRSIHKLSPRHLLQPSQQLWQHHHLHLKLQQHLHLHLHPSKKHPVVQTLPLEIQQFKARLNEKCPERLLKFSFGAMRRVATPPVDIPEEFRGSHVVTTCVSGRKVPFTKNMFENQKRKRHARRLDMIDEYVHYK